jgi:short subunit fatty acids transporter
MLDIIRDLGAGLSRFTERWVPDSWVICMFLTSAALILAVTRLRFGDIVGYTFIVALACFVVTLVAMGLISPHL